MTSPPHDGNNSPPTSAEDGAEHRFEGVIVDEHGKPYNQGHAAYRHLKQTVENFASRIPHGDRLMIFLTGVIALSTVGQLVISCSNNVSTGKQVDRLIDAANRIDGAADSFARSSAGIGKSMDSAVVRMDSAVTRLDAQAKASEKIADATNRASAAALDSNQIANRAYVYPVLSAGLRSCSDQNRTGNYHLHGTLYCVGLSYKNVGQTPAFRVRVTGFVPGAGVNRSFPEEFPPCLEGTHLTAIPKDAMEECEIITLPGEDREVENLLMTGAMPGQAYYVRGYIEFDDIFRHHTKEPFCFFSPVFGSRMDPIRICRDAEDWSKRPQ